MRKRQHFAVCVGLMLCLQGCGDSPPHQIGDVSPLPILRAYRTARLRYGSRTQNQWQIQTLTSTTAGGVSNPSSGRATNGPLYTRPNDPYFYDNNDNRVFLLGAITCCNTPNAGWPYVTAAFLEKLAAHDANYATVRMGPFAYALGETDEPHELPYADAGNRLQNLDQWNPAFWQHIRSLLSKARELGIYVEVDVIDGWILERPERTPWSSGNNVNGVNLGCEVQKQAPSGIVERWVRKVAAETGSFDNVIYQIGNETFDCCGQGSSVAYEVGVARVLRDELQKQGFGSRPVGTNSHSICVECHPEIDYVAKHQASVPNVVCGKPTMVNEYGEGLPFEFRVREAISRGVYWQYWRASDSDSVWEANLDLIQQLHAQN
jgi:hypothetical protein